MSLRLSDKREDKNTDNIFIEEDDGCMGRLLLTHMLEMWIKVTCYSVVLYNENDDIIYSSQCC